MKIAYADMDIRFFIDRIPIQALNIVFERFTRSIPSHSHGNGCYEIHYISAGYGKLQANGRRYDIGPETLYVTGPHVEHAQTPIPSNPMQEYCVYLKIQEFPQRKKASPVMDAFLATPFWIGKDTQEIHAIMRQIFTELEQRYIGFQNQVELLLSQLLICMVRNYEQCQVSRTAFARNNLTDSKSIIIEEYFLYEYQSLSLNNLADRLKLSPRQTQRLLMEQYQKSFQQKKTEARMAAAVVLLADAGKRIAAIAEELGYSSAEHFSSAFRRYYQISPKEYRKQLHITVLEAPVHSQSRPEPPVLTPDRGKL